MIVENSPLKWRFDKINLCIWYTNVGYKPNILIEHFHNVDSHYVDVSSCFVLSMVIHIITKIKVCPDIHYKFSLSRINILGVHPCHRHVRSNVYMLEQFVCRLHCSHEQSVWNQSTVQTVTNYIVITMEMIIVSLNQPTAMPIVLIIKKRMTWKAKKSSLNIN